MLQINGETKGYKFNVGKVNKRVIESGSVEPLQSRTVNLVSNKATTNISKGVQLTQYAGESYKVQYEKI